MYFRANNLLVSWLLPVMFMMMLILMLMAAIIIIIIIVIIIIIILIQQICFHTEVGQERGDGSWWWRWGFIEMRSVNRSLTCKMTLLKSVRLD